MLVCECCGGNVVARSGRRPKFCSAACRQKAHRQKRAERRLMFPEGLRDRARWVRCEGKVPVGREGWRLKWLDESNWLSLNGVLASGWGDGFGFVLGDGVGVIDLDDCVDGEGRLSELAVSVLGENPGAWVELSVSGRGLHVWGLLPEAVGARGKGWEVYSRARFVRCTGVTFRGGGLVPLNV